MGILEAHRCLVHRKVEESLSRLEVKSDSPVRSMRWELASCWIQHLQKADNMKDDRPRSPDVDTEHAVKGLGKQFKFLRKRDKKACNLYNSDDQEEDSSESCSPNLKYDRAEQSIAGNDNETDLKSLLSEEAFLRLKDTGTGLHLMVSPELIYFLAICEIVDTDVLFL